MKVNKYNLNFDLQDKNSDTFNFYDYIKSIYKNDNDEAIKLLSEINKIIVFNDESIDQFWNINATNLLTGIVINFINNKIEPTFVNIYDILLDSKQLKKIFSKDEISYKLVSNILNYDKNVFMSIINILLTQIKPFVDLGSLKKLTEKSSFDYEILKSPKLKLNVNYSNHNMHKIENIIILIINNIKK